MAEHDRLICEACLQKEYEAFSHQCIHESMAQNKLWIGKYRVDDWPRWDYSMDDSTLIFSEQGEARVICDIEVVGSTTSESWERSWGNENFPLGCRKHMGQLYAFGEEKEWDRLTTLVCLEDASDGGEQRDAAIGLTEDWTLLFVVHIVREEDAIRIVSARPATAQERRIYEDND